LPLHKPVTGSFFPFAGGQAVKMPVFWAFLPVAPLLLKAGNEYAQLFA
jgi:hypothetical protein